MANRFWVGGTESWNGTAGSKWSTTSGGAGGAAEPVASDDVFLDAASGAVTVTVAAPSGGVCRSLNMTGFTGTFNLDRDCIIGDGTIGHLTLGSGMVSPIGGSGGGTLKFVSTTGTNNITTNGKTIAVPIAFDGVAGTWQLQDALTQSTNPPGITLTNGTLDTNGKTVTAIDLTLPGGGTKVLTLGASTVNLSGDDSTGTVVSMGATGITINANTSTIVLTSTSASQKTFAGGGYTYNNVNITGGGTGRVLIQGSNTFANLPQITGGTKSLRFTATTTQTYTGGTDFGNGSNLITIDTQTAGSAATLSKSSGTVSVTSISLKDSTAAGGATWKAPTSSGNINNGGNSGWDFTAVGGDAGVTQNSILLGVG